MFEIVFLGTSASAPSVHRGLSSQVVIHDEFRFLIDCGEGTDASLAIGVGLQALEPRTYHTWASGPYPGTGRLTFHLYALGND